jgi:thioester reductase-like protein
VQLLYQSNQTDGYKLSKTVSELLCWKASEMGYMTSIYRPSTISGHSQSGYCNPSDFWVKLLAGIVDCKLFPKEQEPCTFDIIPVDYVVDILMKVSSSKPQHKFYNIAPDKPTTFSDILTVLQELQYSLVATPFDEWLKHIEVIPSNPLLPLLHYFENGQLPSFSVFPSENYKTEIPEMTNVFVTHEILKKYILHICK